MILRFLPFLHRVSHPWETPKCTSKPLKTPWLYYRDTTISSDRYVTRHDILCHRRLLW